MGVSRASGRSQSEREVEISSCSAETARRNMACYIVPNLSEMSTVDAQILSCCPVGFSINGLVRPTILQVADAAALPAVSPS